MVLYALGIGLLMGLLRWRVWWLPLLIAAFVVLDLGVGAGWNANAWRPFNNPIFADLVLKLVLINTVACTIGYVVGRIVAFLGRRLTGGSSSAVPPVGRATPQ